MIIKREFEPETIISYNEAHCITNVEYLYLKETAIKKNHLPSNLTLSNIQKEVIQTNMIYDDEKFISILNENQFTIKHLKSIIRFRDILKNLIIDNSIITPDLKEKITIYKTVVSKLLDIVNKEFNINDSTIILNKICILLVQYPELFLNNNKKRIK